MPKIHSLLLVTSKFFVAHAPTWLVATKPRPKTMRLKPY